MLIAALARLGETFPRAQQLAAVQQGLARPSSVLEVDLWSERLAGAEHPAPTEWTAIEARLAREDRAVAEQPRNPETQLTLAEAALAMAVDPGTARILAADYRTAPDYARLQFEDEIGRAHV